MGGGKKLARNVTVGTVTYGPKDDVPPEVMEKITNPKAWVPDNDETPTDEAENRDAGTSSGAKLAGTVTVGARSYGPNDHIPDDVAAQIKNPKAWAGGKAPTRAAKAAEPRGGDTPTKSTGTAAAATPQEDAAAVGEDAKTATPRKSAGPTKRP
jgi:hypothetical protein